MLGKVKFEDSGETFTLNEEQIASLKYICKKLKHKDVSFDNVDPTITVDLVTDYVIIEGKNVSFINYAVYDEHYKVRDYIIECYTKYNSEGKHSTDRYRKDFV